MLYLVREGQVVLPPPEEQAMSVVHPSGAGMHDIAHT